MSHPEEQPHRKHRPYRRSKAKSTACATIAQAHAHDDDEPWDAAIPDADVASGDPGVAELIARGSNLIDLMRT